MAKINLSIDWKKWYDDHVTDLESAARSIKDGDCVWMGQASSIPYKMLDWMAANKEEYKNVTLLWNVMNVPNDLIFDPDAKKHFKMMSAYNLPLERMAIEMNNIECGGTTYDYLAYWPQEYNCNTLACHVCPPDENGWCNVGHYNITTNQIISRQDYMTNRIAFIDKTGQWPIPGDVEMTSIHITEFDHIVENMDTDLAEIPAQPPSEIDKQIASHILPYIKEGDKIQIGFGGLGEEILANLRGIGKLEVYSEVACDNMATLCEEGVLTKVVASSPGACSKVFMDFVSKDPRAVIRPQPEMIDPLGVMQQENIVAINATFQVDLIGQACSEAQGLMPYSGPGGSFAYIYGVTRAKNGRSFLCLRSTYVDREGQRHSNVHPWLPEGCIVTTPKQFVMYLVTEYGVADVFLKSLKDRIKAILKIAHPDYRQELKDKICTTPLIKEDDFVDYDLFDNIPK
jgi:acyl-CoA hydrolase